MEVYRKKSIPWRIIDTEAFVVNPKTSLIYPLNTTATRIWQLFDGTKDIAEIIEIMEKEFQIDKETLKADVASFIAQLKEAGLIEAV